MTDCLKIFFVLMYIFHTLHSETCFYYDQKENFKKTKLSYLPFVSFLWGRRVSGTLKFHFDQKLNCPVYCLFVFSLLHICFSHYFFLFDISISNSTIVIPSLSSAAAWFPDTSNGGWGCLSETARRAALFDPDP